MPHFLSTSCLLTGLFFATGASAATVVGFGNLGGSNTTIPANLASRATTSGNGYSTTVSGPNHVLGTPNIAVSWHPDWDIHTSNHFTELENQTVGGGAWDNEGNVPRIAQTDVPNLWIDFTADNGYSLQLNSFDFANTPETTDSHTWTFSLTDLATSAVVWSQTSTLTNNDSDVITVTPNFTGQAGHGYRLFFGGGGSHGQHGMDNLSFAQIPEPTSSSLAAIGLGAFLLRRRR